MARHHGGGGLDLIDVVLGEVLEDVADVDVLLDGGAVQPHVAPLRQGLDFLAAGKERNTYKYCQVQNCVNFPRGQREGARRRDSRNLLHRNMHFRVHRGLLSIT